MKPFFYIDLDVIYIIFYLFIVFICLTKKIFEDLGGHTFSIVKLEFLFFLSFVIYHLIYFVFIFIILYNKAQMVYYDSILIDKVLINYFIIEIFNTLDVYFLLVFLSCFSSCFVLSLNITENFIEDKNKLFLLCLNYLICFIYFFSIFSCSFCFFIVLSLK